jgi:hypothetical protein
VRFSQTPRLCLYHVVLQILFLGLAWTVLGCGLSSTPATGSSESNLPIIGQSLSGKAMDGAQPVVGAHVYLLAANTGGYGSASASLLEASDTGYSDSVGAYVMTALDGSFSISQDYSCTAGRSGSGSGATNNNFYVTSNTCTGSIASLGTCSFSVVFAPTVTGSQSATVNILSNAPSSPNSVSLSGTAQ